MSNNQVVDPEFEVLCAKVDELTKERDDALKLAEDAAKKLAETKSKVEHFRRLWEGSERRLRKEQS